MNKQRRSFPTEFKYEVVCLVLDQGYSVAEACRPLDAGDTADAAGLINKNWSVEARPQGAKP